MSNQRTTFAKRQREQNRKDKLRAKQERLAARRANPSLQKGPPTGPNDSSYDAPNGQHHDITDGAPVDGGPEAPADDLPSD